MKKLLLIATAVAAVLLIGCKESRAVKLTVVNKSSATMSKIVVVGSGVSTPIGVLAPGVQLQVPLNTDMGAFKLEFDADGKHFSEASGTNPWNDVKENIMTVNADFSVYHEAITSF